MGLLEEHLLRHPDDTARNQIEAVSVPILSTIGIMTDWGVIPPSPYPNKNYFPTKLESIGIMTDWGVIPPKNYFRTKISTIGIDLGQFAETRLKYQIQTR